MRSVIASSCICSSHFALSNGHVTAENGQIDLTPIDLLLTNVGSTNDTPALFRLSASNKQGGEFISEGQFQLAPISSRGKITLSKLPLSTLMPFCPEKKALTFNGIGDLSMNFRVAIHEKSLAFFIEDAHLVLDNIVYQDKNRPSDHASLQHFDLDKPHHCNHEPVRCEQPTSIDHTRLI